MLNKLIIVGLFYILCTSSYAQFKVIKIPALDSVLTGYQFVEHDTLGHTFTTVQKAAEFRGGLAGWTAYLEKNLNRDLGAKYIKLKKSDTTARQTVIVSFTVGANGLITDVSAERNGAHPKLIEEAIRVVRDGPRWEPARLDVFENIDGQIPVQKILDKNKSGFTKCIYRHKQNITFVCTKE
jgi:hypothetical protein